MALSKPEKLARNMAADVIEVHGSGRTVESITELALIAAMSSARVSPRGLNSVLALMLLEHDFAVSRGDSSIRPLTITRAREIQAENSQTTWRPS